MCLEWFILVSFIGMRVRGKPVNQIANTNYFSSFLKACPINKRLMLMCSSYLRPRGGGGVVVVRGWREQQLLIQCRLSCHFEDIYSILK